MGKGSCYCGKVSYTFEGEALNKAWILPQAVCHCIDCQKISGSAFSTNIVVPAKDFQVNGTPKKYSAKAASGRTVTTVFCGDCGSPLWREGEFTDPDAKIIRVGTLDDKEALDAAKPFAEVYTKDRASWLGDVPEAKQFPEMF